ncbi:hypothetical protein [Streptomyces sp. NPDC056105]|uniref:hypothetical protein n=1 Tax=Streptomyces sp. NPDC056105 TaxID=3345714 RepID=UPI0035E39FFA
MIKKLTLAVTVTLVAALAPSATATAAAAAAPVKEITGQGLAACPRDAICLYQNSDFNEGDDARIWIVTGTTARLGDGSDEASSIYSNVGRYQYARAHRDVDGKGDSVFLFGGESIANLKYVKQFGQTENFNDSISSVTFV